MAKLAHQVCLICGSRAIALLLQLTEQGAPHGTAGHVFSYSYALITICHGCGNGQLETFSHDCFHYYGDEDWDMFWWHALPAADLTRLREALRLCPQRLNAQCECPAHASLRRSAERLWAGIPHALSPGQQMSFAWISVEDQDGQIRLMLNRRRGIGQAAS